MSCTAPSPNSKKNFRKGDIVWAKVRGHPWWPATFLEFYQARPSEEQTVVVNFIGDKSHAYLGISKVVGYQENRLEYGKTKRKDLTDAINAADVMALKNPSIRLGEKNDVDKSVPEVKEAKKQSLAKKRVIVESESEEERSAPTSRDGKISSLEDAKKVLERLLTSKDHELATGQKENLRDALKVIHELVTEHSTIMDSGIGVSLKKFVETYASHVQLKEMVEYSQNCLESLERIVLNAYFGKGMEGNTETVRIVEPVTKRKRLRHSDTPENVAKVLSQADNNKENKAEATPLAETVVNKAKVVTVIPEAAPKSELAQVETEIEEAKATAKDLALMISVCQEIAKLVEEVSLA